MSKLHLGYKSGQPGLWVAGPGGDASAASSNFLVDSDFPLLKVWAQGDTEQASSGAVSGIPQFSPLSIYFTALPYIPIAFACTSLNNKPLAMCYPPTIGYRGTYSFDTDSSLVIFTNRIWVPGGANSTSTRRIRWIVFANRLDDDG